MSDIHNTDSSYLVRLNYLLNFSLNFVLLPVSIMNLFLIYLTRLALHHLF